MIILWKRVIILNSLLILVCDYFKLSLLSLLSVIIPSTRDPWLGYDITKNLAFCLVCILHPHKLQNDSFTKIGFKDWNHAIYKFSQHLRSNEHAFSMSQFNSRKSGDENICSKLVKVRKDQVIENRGSLSKIIRIILLLARQGLSFRGHNETEASFNKGNFKEFLEFCSSKDTKLNTFLTSNKTANYTSPLIQNELIELVAGQIRSKIIRLIINSSVYAIMVDGTTDVSTSDQFSFCTRVVDVDFKIHEKFLDSGKHLRLLVNIYMINLGNILEIQKE